MFSALGQIILGRPREAESTDARLGIRRHDPDQERRRKKEGEADGPSAFDTDDSATVSVEALRLFLENFLASLQTGAVEDAPQMASAEIEMPPAPQRNAPRENSPVAGQAAQAASAYQSSARATEKNADAPSAGAMPAIKLEAHEVRSIHSLLDDLTEISGHGVEFLTIGRSDTFLHSLEEAVQKIKNPEA